jgi:hypothetical protein
MRQAGTRAYIINVDDLPAEMTALRKLPLHIPNDIISGSGGSRMPAHCHLVEKA